MCTQGSECIRGYTNLMVKVTDCVIFFLELVISNVFFLLASQSHVLAVTFLFLPLYVHMEWKRNRFGGRELNCMAVYACLA